MEKIVLLGCGGHAKSIIDSIESQGIYDIVGFTDDIASNSFNYRGYQVLGRDDILSTLFQSGVHNAFVCVGYLGKGRIRNHLYEQLKELGYLLPVVVDPSAVLAKDIRISEGCFVGKRVVINSSAQVGKMAIINTGAIIEHDCVVGEFSHVAVGAVLCGGVSLGAGSMVGANATVIQGASLPQNSFVKSGTIWKG